MRELEASYLPGKDDEKQPIGYLSESDNTNFFNFNPLQSFVTNINFKDLDEQEQYFYGHNTAIGTYSEDMLGTLAEYKESMYTACGEAVLVATEYNRAKRMLTMMAQQAPTLDCFEPCKLAI